MASLLAKLSIALGSHQAAIEYNWMRQAACAPHDLCQMVNRRAQGEPLQYILGTQPFGPLTLLTRPPTLIPRPETEQWTSDLAEKLLKRSTWRPLRVLDFCTGSGCIPLLLGHLLSLEGVQMTALGVDVSPSACQLARDNLASSGLASGCSLDIQQKDIFDDDFWEFVKKAFRAPRMNISTAKEDALRWDVVTANPPYIPRDQWLDLPREVKDWEDPLALLGDPCPDSRNKIPVSPRREGLTFYERIRDLLSYSGILSDQSILAMEVGDGQVEDVLKIFDQGLGRTEVWRDLWGKERAVFIYGQH